MGETETINTITNRTKSDQEPFYDPLLESDDDEDGDLDDLPMAFTPVKMDGEFKKEDLVFAKYRSYPHWPAVFHSYLRKNKKRKHKGELTKKYKNFISIMCFLTALSLMRYLTAAEIRGEL